VLLELDEINQKLSTVTDSLVHIVIAIGPVTLWCLFAQSHTHFL